MRRHRAVDVDRTFGPAGRAAREVEQCHVLRVGWSDGETLGGIRHEAVPPEKPFPLRRILPYEDDVLQAGQPLAQLRDLAPVERRGRDEHTPLAHLDPGRDRLWTEGGKERGDDAARLQRAEHGDVKLRQSSHQNEYAFSRLHAQDLQRIGETIGLCLQIAIGDVAPLAALADPADGRAVAPRPDRVSIHRLVSDVAALAAGEPVE